MKIYAYRKLAVISCMLLILPGCTTLIDWGKKTLYQGVAIPQNYNVPRSYIRSVTAYDQFSMIAHFDCLWLSQEVRNAYVHLYAESAGKRGEQKAHLQKLQQDELRHFITFYVVVPQEIVLGQLSSLWHLFLSVDQLTYDPIEVRTIEIDSVYKCFFGSLLNRFKTVYQVKFEAKDLYDNPVILSTTEKIELHFRMITKELLLEWELIPHTKHSSFVRAKKKSDLHSEAFMTVEQEKDKGV